MVCTHVFALISLALMVVVAVAAVVAVPAVVVVVVWWLALNYSHTSHSYALHNTPTLESLLEEYILDEQLVGIN